MTTEEFAFGTILQGRYNTAVDDLKSASRLGSLVAVAYYRGRRDGFMIALQEFSAHTGYPADISGRIG